MPLGRPYPASRAAEGCGALMLALRKSDQGEEWHFGEEEWLAMADEESATISGDKYST